MLIKTEKKRINLFKIFNFYYIKNNFKKLNCTIFTQKITQLKCCPCPT